MAFNPTDEQKLAIYEKGSIIVSAAAGSGKTAVLVERVADLLLGEGPHIDADKLLIVTFTKTAAAELRARIEKKMNEEFSEHSDNPEYQRQQLLLSAAKICTIDSFCIDFLKENYEDSPVSPSFKMCDNATLLNLENSAMLTLVEECFESKDDEFRKLLDFFGEGYDDSALRQAITDIFKFSRNMPFPDHWLANIVKDYEDHAAGKKDDWFKGALIAVSDKAQDAVVKMNEALSVLSNDSYAYGIRNENYNYIQRFAEELSDICKEGDWDAVLSYLNGLDIPGAGTIKKDNKTEICTSADKIRDDAKKTIVDIKTNIVYADKETVCKEIGYVVPYIKKLISLVQRYADILYSLLEEQDFLTFYMAEQAVLAMLAEIKDGEIVRRADADRYVENYGSILVDEYQDTNNLQDSLFHILSDSGKNLFCVGDMKQSIYRFRGSNPLNFLLKKNSAVMIKDRTEEDMLRVDLSANFRSRHEICEYINSLFTKILYKENSDFDYDKDEALKPEAKFEPVSDSKVELHFCDFNAINSSVPEKFDSRVDAEAQVLANIVKSVKLIKNDENESRFGYKDIKILVRSMKTSGNAIIKALKDCGIPVSASSGDVLESDEVQTLIALLKVINNPRDDISMVTVMTSPIFAFSFDEMAKLRKIDKYASFISNVIVAANEGNEKASAFLDVITRLRLQSAVISVSSLIDEIFEETNLLNIFALSKYGEIKRLNLLAVQNIARSFEGEIRRDLRSFINYFEGLDSKDISLSTENTDAVTVMTIHKSKGLQFPVCILADAAKETYEKDLGGTVLTSDKYGVSVKYHDEDFIVHKNFLLRVAMESEERKLLYAEELRLLYVALTRAQEKLIVVSTFKKFEDKINKFTDDIYFSNSKSRVEYSLYRSCKSYADWITTALMVEGKTSAILGDGSDPTIITHKSIPTVACTDGDDASKKEDSSKAVETKPDYVAQLTSNYEYEYEYAPLLDLQAKSSVTDIVHKADDKLYRFSKRPAFLQEKGLSSAEKGTATHKIMQYVDFAKCPMELDEEIERLHEYFYLSDSEYEAIDRTAVKTFFDSSLFKRIASADLVRREMKFLTEFPASTLKPELAGKFDDEMIVVQGAVDLIFVKDGVMHIVDFKTDKNKSSDDLLAAYSEQLRIYAKACGKILGLPVGELLLYSFSLGDTISVTP